VIEIIGWVDPPEYISGYNTVMVQEGYQDPDQEIRERYRRDGKRRWRTEIIEGAWHDPVYEDQPIYTDPAPYPIYGPVTYHLDATEYNYDPSHPLSYQRLGRWIDLPLITLPKVTDSSIVRTQARQALIEGSTVPVRARLTTRVMIRGLNEVYELDMKDAYGNPIESGQGRYWCRGWTLQLGSPWEMVHNLVRVVGFDVAAGLTQE
jgi:hypothetical protein